MSKPAVKTGGIHMSDCPWQVLANDLNPISYKYLQQNITLNKVQQNVTAFNMDGRAFIRRQCDLAQPAADPQTPKGMQLAGWFY